MKNTKFENYIKDIENIIEYLKSHNKNYNKTQYYLILELDDKIKKLKEDIKK